MCADQKDLPPILIHQPHWIIGTIGVRTHSGVLVRHRVHREPDGERGVVVPRRGGRFVWVILSHL